MSDWLEALSAVFFPPRCIFCGDVVRYKEMVCPACAAALEACERAGVAVRGEIQCAAPYRYADFVREKLLAIKKREGRILADWFAPRMTACIRRTFAGEKIGWVTYVPGWEKEGERVYNQARVLARRIARELSLPLYDALYQTRPKERQHTLTASERVRNVRDLYALRDETAERVSGSVVLLVDDIVTTGATLRACAQALSGARVLCAAVAATDKEERTPEGSGMP